MGNVAKESTGRFEARTKEKSRSVEVVRNENAPHDANFLSMYFREMSELAVLQPKEEAQIARRIEEREIVLWERILALPTALEWVLNIVTRAEFEDSLPSFRAVRASATKLKSAPSKQKKDAYRRACRRLAENIHPVDRDRLVQEAIVEQLIQLHRLKAGRGGAHGLPFSTRTKLFSDYVNRLVSADNAARRARNDFVRANLRLVVSIARRFNYGRMSLADLIQEGNIGLMKAVERYDYRRGFRFSTYASWWIRHAISRALADKGREVRLPVHMIDAQHRLARAKRELTTKLGRLPNSTELAAVTNLTAAKIDKMSSYLVDQPLSLEKPINDEDGRRLIDVLEDPTSASLDVTEKLSHETMARAVRSILLELKPIEADILRRRFGLDDDQALTLKEIGQRYNLSRERIRQLQEQALTKMRDALDRRALL